MCVNALACPGSDQPAREWDVVESSALLRFFDVVTDNKNYSSTNRDDMGDVVLGLAHAENQLLRRVSGAGAPKNRVPNPDGLSRSRSAYEPRQIRRRLDRPGR